MKSLTTIETVCAHLLTSAEVKRAAAESCALDVVKAAQVITESFRRRGRLLLCGNGGSAADCQHIAAEFVSLLTQDYARPALAAIALTTDTSFLTANANDFGFAGVFERQVEALGREGDALLGISTSGNSENVVRAVTKARGLGMASVVFTGAGGGKLAGLADVCVRAPSDSTQHIQECHIAFAHVMCAMVERELFPR